MPRKPPKIKLAALDVLTYNGASILANRIVVYWAERGHTVNAEPYELPDSEGVYGVRTDLVAGLPRT